MNTTKLLTIGALLTLLGPTMVQAFATSDYFAAYPNIAKRDASYTFTTCNFAGTGTSLSDNLYCIASSAEQTSGGTVNPYLSQVYAMYQYSNNNISFHSEVHYVDSSGNAQYVSCETQTGGCHGLGAASGIGNVKHEQFWSGGHIKYYVEVYDKSNNFVNSYFNPDYVPGTDDTSSKFASGTQTDTNTNTKYKLTQWGVEGVLPNAPTGWNLEQSGMSTFYGSTSYPFASDPATTTDPGAGSTDGSYIVHRVVSGIDNRLTVGDYKYCVKNNNNVAGDIKWQDSTTCLSAGTSLW